MDAPVQNEIAWFRFGGPDVLMSNGLGAVEEIMSRVELSRIIPASANEVWAVVSDIGAVHEFHPQIVCSPITNGQARGVGAERRCELVDGSEVSERVTDWHEGRSMTIAILETAAPILDGRASFFIERALGASSRVTFTMEYVPDMGMFSGLLDALVLRRRMARLMGDVLEGLEAKVTKSVPHFGLAG